MKPSSETKSEQMTELEDLDEHVNSDSEQIEEPESFLVQLENDIDSWYLDDASKREEKISYYLQNSQLLQETIQQGFVGDRVAQLLVRMCEWDDYTQNDQKQNSLRQLGRELAFTYQHELEESLSQGYLAPSHALQMYRLLAEEGNEQMRKAAIEALSKHRERIADLVESEKNDLSPGFLRPLILYGTQQQQLQGRDIIHNALKKNLESKYMPQLVEMLFEFSDCDSLGKGLVNMYLERHGLDYDNIFPEWMLSTTPEPAKIFMPEEEQKDILPFHKAVRYNLSCIQNVEKQAPGACKWLRDEWGVADYGRYPAEVLSLQFLRRFDASRPYGIVVMPRADWNGAFYANEFVLYNLLNDIKKDSENIEFNLRVAECDGKVGLVRILRKFNQIYNIDSRKGCKISLMILGGHGTEDSVLFGRSWKKSDKLTMADLERVLSSEPRDYFEDQPTFLLASCSTGAEGGIGQKLSHKYGAKLIAQKSPTGMTKASAGRTRGGRWRFHAFYADRGAKRVYKQGMPTEAGKATRR